MLCVAGWISYPLELYAVCGWVDIIPAGVVCGVWPWVDIILGWSYMRCVVGWIAYLAGVLIVAGLIPLE